MGGGGSVIAVPRRISEGVAWPRRSAFQTRGGRGCQSAGDRLYGRGPLMERLRREGRWREGYRFPR